MISDSDAFILSEYMDVYDITENISLVRHIQTDKLYIKKTIPTRQGEIYRELKLCKHQNIVNVFHVLEKESEMIVIREYVHGETLRCLLQREHTLDNETVLSYALQLCDAIDFLHSLSKPIVHRDIKPENIIVTESGNIKIIDFDISRRLKQEAVKDTFFAGTRGYSPPEQFGFAETDQRADVFAFGVILNEMLTGEIPSDLSKCRGRVKSVIEKCIQIDRTKRYSSISEVKRKLEKCGLNKNKRSYSLVIFGLIALISLWLLKAFLFQAKISSEEIPTADIPLVTQTLNTDIPKNHDEAEPSETLSDFKGQTEDQPEEANTGHYTPTPTQSEHLSIDEASTQDNQYPASTVVNEIAGVDPITPSTHGSSDIQSTTTQIVDETMPNVAITPPIVTEAAPTPAAFAASRNNKASGIREVIVMTDHVYIIFDELPADALEGNIREICQRMIDKYITIYVNGKEVNKFKSIDLLWSGEVYNCFDFKFFPKEIVAVPKGDWIISIKYSYLEDTWLYDFNYNELTRLQLDFERIAINIAITDRVSYKMKLDELDVRYNTLSYMSFEMRTDQAIGAANIMQLSFEDSSSNFDLFFCGEYDESYATKNKPSDHYTSEELNNFYMSNTLFSPELIGEKEGRYVFRVQSRENPSFYRFIILNLY